MRTDRKPVPPFSIRDAAARGIARVRQPNWADPLEHIKLDLMPNQRMGPWVHLYSPSNLAINGRDPVDMLALRPSIDVDAKCLYAYTGPLPDSDEYKAAAAVCGSCKGQGRTQPDELCKACNGTGKP